MDEARAVVADFCEKNPYLLGALPMTWFGCGPFARMVVAGVIYELRLVITRALAIADREDNNRGAKEALAAEARVKMGL